MFELFSPSLWFHLYAVVVRVMRLCFDSCPVPCSPRLRHQLQRESLLCVSYLYVTFCFLLCPVLCLHFVSASCESFSSKTETFQTEVTVCFTLCSWCDGSWVMWTWRALWDLREWAGWGRKARSRFQSRSSNKTPFLLWAWGLFRCAVGRLPLVWGETQSHRYQLKKLERKSIFVCKTRQKAKIGMSWMTLTFRGGIFHPLLNGSC